MSVNAAGPSKATKIVIRGVNWLGDAVMCTPALQRLREARPNDSITLITEEKLAELWMGHPAVDGIIPFSRKESVFGVARRLRAESFDIALLLPNSFRSATECFLARIPRRIGYARNGRGPLLTDLIRKGKDDYRMRKRSTGEIRRLVRSPALAVSSETPAGVHQMHHYLHLVQALGASGEPQPPKIAVASSTIEQVLAKFQLDAYRQLGIPLLGLNPGAEYGPAKRWPEERFIVAAAEVQRNMDCCWLIFGGAGDGDVAAHIASGIRSASRVAAGDNHPRVVNLAGRTSLGELGAALSLCNVVLTNDTGPMHLAAAVGATVVAPFGSTSPELTAPGLPEDRRHRILRVGVPCSPCFRRTCPIDFRCMNGIQSQDVAAAVLKAFGRVG